MNPSVTERNELIDVATAWDRAMVENEAEAIGRYMAQDWMIVGSDAGGDRNGSWLRKASNPARARSPRLTRFWRG